MKSNLVMDAAYALQSASSLPNSSRHSNRTLKDALNVDRASALAAHLVSHNLVIFCFSAHALFVLRVCLLKDILVLV